MLLQILNFIYLLVWLTIEKLRVESGIRNFVKIDVETGVGYITCHHAKGNTPFLKTNL